MNYVKMLDLDLNSTTEKGLFGFWAEEPFVFVTPDNPEPQSHIVQWKFDHIRSHYPSEHRFLNVSADLEIQIFHTDELGLKLACRGGQAAISLFFNLSSNVTNNGFFDSFSTIGP